MTVRTISKTPTKSRVSPQTCAGQDAIPEREEEDDALFWRTALLSPSCGEDERMEDDVVLLSVLVRMCETSSAMLRRAANISPALLSLATPFPLPTPDPFPDGGCGWRVIFEGRQEASRWCE